jgi:hypothetical protein
MLKENSFWDQGKKILALRSMQKAISSEIFEKPQVTPEKDREYSLGPEVTFFYVTVRFRVNPWENWSKTDHWKWNCCQKCGNDVSHQGKPVGYKPETLVPTKSPEWLKWCFYGNPHAVWWCIKYTDPGKHSEAQNSKLKSAMGHLRNWVSHNVPRVLKDGSSGSSVFNRWF